MVKEIIKFGNTEIEKHNIHCNEYPVYILLAYWWLARILLVKNYKYGNGHKDDDYKTKSLCKIYQKLYDSETKWMLFDWRLGIIKNI